MVNVFQEYKDELERVQRDRDLYRALLIDQVRHNRQVSREQATEMVDWEIFERRGPVGLDRRQA